MTLRNRFFAWTVASVLLGFLGGWVGKRFFDAPFYFGFFCAFTMVGLAGLFALAVQLENDRERRMNKAREKK